MKCPRRRHASYELGKTALWVIGQQGRINTSKMGVFPCKTCHGWHIMKVPRNDVNLIRQGEHDERTTN